MSTWDILDSRYTNMYIQICTYSAAMHSSLCLVWACMYVMCIYMYYTCVYTHIINVQYTHIYIFSYWKLISSFCAPPRVKYTF